MNREIAIFAAGCFWGVQYYFDQVPGVTKTEVGYIGGKAENPSYEQVSYEETGHAEAVKITYDPDAVIAGSLDADAMQGAGEQRTELYKDGTAKEQAESVTPQRAVSNGGVGGSADKQAAALQVLLLQFFRMHDPTQMNRQGPDVGRQYRTAIFYLDGKQKATAQKIIDKLNREKFNGKIVTALEEAGKFWPAEEYHQKFTEKTGRGACHIDYAPV